MSEAAIPYRVAYSQRVKRCLLKLAAIAIQRGDGDSYLAALKDFQQRLTTYPQFGDPLIDLKHKHGQIWNGIIRPIGMRYAIYENIRLVTVTALPVLLPRARSEPCVGSDE